jgi:hypothetical protein
MIKRIVKFFLELEKRHRGSRDPLLAGDPAAQKVFYKLKEIKQWKGSLSGGMA